MPYIEAHSELRDHPKTKRLKRMLKASLPAAIGHLQCLWWWAMDYAPDGDLTRFEAADIADGAEWEDDAQTFVDALLESGFGGGAGFLEKTADGRLLIHDWSQYGGKLLAKRQADADRKRNERAEGGRDINQPSVRPAPPVQTNSAPVVSTSEPSPFLSVGHPSDGAGRVEVEQSRVDKRSVEEQRVEQRRGEESPRGEPTPQSVVEPCLPASAVSASMPNGNSASALPVPTALLVPLTLVERLMEAGLDKAGATKFAKERPAECERQLRFWPYREPEVRTGGYLHKAIKNGYNAPDAYTAAHPPPGAPKPENGANASSEAYAERERAAENRVVTAPETAGSKRPVPFDWMPGVPDPEAREMLNKAWEYLKSQNVVTISDQMMVHHARKFWRDAHPDAPPMPWEDKPNKPAVLLDAEGNPLAAVVAAKTETPRALSSKMAAIGSPRSAPTSDEIAEPSPERLALIRQQTEQLRAEMEEAERQKTVEAGAEALPIADPDVYSAPNNLGQGEEGGAQQGRTVLEAGETK